MTKTGIFIGRVPNPFTVIGHGRRDEITEQGLRRPHHGQLVHVMTLGIKRHITCKVIESTSAEKGK